MFGAPGRLYVYFSYGMHWCANVVVELNGVAGAVLLRAATPLRGVGRMGEARGSAAGRSRDLGSGPAKVCQAMGIDGTHDGADLVTADRGISIRDDHSASPRGPVQTTRIGLSKGAESPWRWYVDGVPDVSVKAGTVEHE